MARLVPAGQARRAEIDGVIEELIAAREGARLDGLDWEELRDEGRP